jgi:cytosine/adenosine deaminase-related metal-dependent hydrolase
MDGAPIENGAVAVSKSNHRRRNVSEISAQHRAGRYRSGDQALLPVLINAHCHLDYTCLRGKIPPQKSFTDWIRAINTEKSKLSGADYLGSIAEGFVEAKRFGTTTIANLTAFPELISRIDSPIRTWWFAELIDARSPERVNELVDLAIESLKSAENSGAPHALFTASKDLYRRCEEVAGRENILLTTHLAESREEMSMFRDGSGPLYAFMKGIGRDMSDCGGTTPLAAFIGTTGSEPDWHYGALPEHWIIAHLNELAESDFELLGNSPGKFDVVHSPRSHDYFAHSRFPFERLRALGFNICLGTDSLGNED